MTQYDNTNRGALFKNDKQGNESRPDYTGNLNVAGMEYRVSAWLKTGKSGAKFMSLSVQPKQEQRVPTMAEQAKAKGQPEPFVDDDIPF